MWKCGVLSSDVTQTSRNETPIDSITTHNTPATPCLDYTQYKCIEEVAAQSRR
jgi:hypothetical protein